MRRAFELACQGHGQVVAVIGDPGVGKSRLYFEFKAIPQAECLVLEAYSVSHGKTSAYLPVIDLLKSYFEIMPEDDERKRREKVIVPVYFAYNNNYLYSFSTVGQKIEWMRVNPLVCVEVDEVVSPQQWTNVIVVGRYEELPDTPEWRNEQELAYKMLHRTRCGGGPVTRVQSSTARSAGRCRSFYRIKVVQITGQRGTYEPEASPDTRLSMPSLSENGWLQKSQQQIRAKFRKE
jgi:nitroimidazol reductase NimA-like FMN-containing flavoprotein (pyridoxamine 5'-phosphate oxidase superfamily)